MLITSSTFALFKPRSACRIHAMNSRLGVGTSFVGLGEVEAEVCVGGLGGRDVGVGGGTTLVTGRGGSEARPVGRGALVAVVDGAAGAATTFPPAPTVDHTLPDDEAPVDGFALSA